MALVEVLVSLLVVAIGALAVAGLQRWLHVHADLARQRSEATRLAQAQMERLRAFEQLDAQPGAQAWDDIVSGEDSPAPAAANTRFARHWQVTGDRDDLARRVVMHVDWATRADEAATRRVELVSVIARTDPRDVARLIVPPPGGQVVRRAHGRALGIPSEAVRLGGRHRGRSALAWSGRREGYLVFNDADGSVVAHCALRPGDDTDLEAACERFDALLLEGHVGGRLPAGPLLPVFEALTLGGPDPAADCLVAPVVDPARETPLLRYRCLMSTAEDDGDAATPKGWSARLRWFGLDAGQRVCRYAGSAPPPSGVAPDPGSYTRVRTTLRDQNFLLVAPGDGGSGCPTGTIDFPT